MRLQELELKSICGGGIKQILTHFTLGIIQVMKSYLRFSFPRVR